MFCRYQGILYGGEGCDKVWVIAVGYFALASFVFVCDFGVKDQFIGVIAQRLSRVIEFTEVEPLSVDEFPDLRDELDGPFGSHFFASDVSEICLLFTC